MNPNISAKIDELASHAHTLPELNHLDTEGLFNAGLGEAISVLTDAKNDADAGQFVGCLRKAYFVCELLEQLIDGTTSRARIECDKRKDRMAPLRMEASMLLPVDTWRTRKSTSRTESQKE